ncbi:MAG TPA: hypothetical protein VK054_09390 [Beutenbergiaceae bacterium]|nr:hypothetical protein [Beutenbergiaceae bacterium]
MVLLFRMRSGSHLYGTNTAASDEDWFEVYDRLPGWKQSAQKIFGDQDVTRVGLGEFVRQAEKGVPQALEAMFAPDDWPEVDLISAYRRSWRPSTGAVVGTYRRTIKAFALSGNPKQERHAQRLQYQLDQMLRYGRFNPRDTTWLDGV